MDFVSNDLFHSFKIALVPIHDDSFVTHIEFVSELLAEGLNGSLHECLLSIDVKHAVLAAGVLSDVGCLL